VLDASALREAWARFGYWTPMHTTREHDQIVATLCAVAEDHRGADSAVRVPICSGKRKASQCEDFPAQPENKPGPM
jgi:hypothetical protein